jgi:lysophospholipase L1-like esterase
VLGLERPPRWAILLLVTLVVGNTALFAYLTLRPDPVDPFAGRPAPVAATTSSAPAPPPEEPAAEESATADEPQVLAVYGDGYSTGSTLGGLGPAGWPALVAEDLDAELRLNAVSMAGFAQAGSTGQDFSDIATASPVPDADVTVVFGSRNDLGNSAIAVGGGAAETFRAIRAAAPETELVVVGPAWSDAAVPSDLYLLRNAVEAAALDADATFIDPLDDGWFATTAGLIAPDGISPTDAGHELLADRIAPVVEVALRTTD